jgi:hypothetical protein
MTGLSSKEVQAINVGKNLASKEVQAINVGKNLASKEVQAINVGKNPINVDDIFQQTPIKTIRQEIPPVTPGLLDDKEVP